jgi:cytochrome c-type biogenesis protein CcmH
MTIWLIFAAMAAVAVLFIVRPLLSDSRALSLVLVVSVVALSTGLYYRVGSPGTPSGPGHAGDESLALDEMIDGLAARLREQPDDIPGWRMLGRSYMQVGDYPSAIDAFERVIELETSDNAQSLVELGEAYVASNNQEISPREVAIFENAVTIDPNNQAALFWSGIAASSQGNNALAADRWEKLLNSNPPPNPEVSQLLSARIAEWRGVPVAAAGGPAAGPAAASPEPSPAPATEAEPPAPDVGDGIRVALDASAAARSAAPANATVFLIARDPAQPSPPIAVQRRQLSELPTRIVLSDRDSMVPGRNISAFPEVELVARISISGSPMQQSGDWFAAVNAAPGADLEVTIDQQVE